MLIRLLVKNGHRVTVIAPEQPGLKPADGYDLVLMKAGHADFLTAAWYEALRDAFAEVLRKGRPDHIFSESYYALGLEKAAAGIPLTAFVHNFHLVHFHKQFSEVDSLRSLAYFFLITVPRLLSHMFRYEIPFLRGASQVVSVSIRNSELLKDFYRLEPKKVFVLHNWVETELFAPSQGVRASARARLGLRETDTAFLALGALWRPKGFQVAIEAFKRNADKSPGTILLLAGAGPYEARLKEAAGNLLHAGRVKFLGEIPRSDLPSLYNAADVFIMPSIHPEGLPYTLIEAMSAGLPPIATALGGNIETVGQAGILVPGGGAVKLGDAMLALTTDLAYRKTLGEAARRRALELFAENTALRKVTSLLE
jgi:glycosyltransferase involved in cell wall biosynthesis